MLTYYIETNVMHDDFFSDTYIVELQLKAPILALAVWRAFSTYPPYVGASLSGPRSSKLEKIASEYRGEVYCNILEGREKPTNQLGEISIPELTFFNAEHGTR